jgi:MFS family permease
MPEEPAAPHPRLPARLPFFYGWVIVGIAFVTMAISVTARTAFSLLLPPLIDEFGWDRGLAAGAFSFGFLVSAVLGPIVGRAVDRHGPRPIIMVGVVALGAGLLWATLISSPLELYLTLGLLVGAGVNCMGFSVQSLYLPQWFARRRGLAIGIAFSGVGAGAILLLPWLQVLIETEGWRSACRAMGIVAIVVLAPINLFIWRRPADLGLRPDGDAPGSAGGVARRRLRIVDAAWAATDWTLRRALRTQRFWWICLGYFCSLFSWYMVQIHQTKYLVEIGFPSMEAAWALGLVSIFGIPGQIFGGALSDRIGREWVWSLSCAGFALCYLILILMEHQPSALLLYLMIATQGLLGYAMSAVMGPIVVEIFEGPHYGSIFGVVTIALIGGGAVGPWVAGLVHDQTGSYRLAFELAILASGVSALAVWLAAPRRVRAVPGWRAPAG